MAQLSNDCFAFGGPLMSVIDAAALIAERLSPVTEARPVPLVEADGRVLAGDLVSPIALPPFDNSAVDGYAARFGDLEATGDTALPVEGRVAAGGRFEGTVAGRAVRIFTGAPMPEGLDTVFMQEDVRLEGSSVLLPAGLKRGANRRLAGEDVQRGVRVLSAGRRLTPQDIGLLAALGLAEVVVRRRLRVAVFSTGNEVVSPGDPPGPATIYDANRFMLQAALRRLGCEVTDLGILDDDRSEVAEALSSAAGGHDLLVTSGGVSTGEEDHVKAAVEDVGSLTFWRLAIKPGRPVALGVIKGVPFIGLPGNPVAVYVTFVNVARALIARLCGESWERPRGIPVRSHFAYGKKAGRREYVRVRLLRAKDGAPAAERHPREGAGVITSLTETDGLVELPESVTAVTPGDLVDYLPYPVLL